MVVTFPKASVADSCFRVRLLFRIRLDTSAGATYNASFITDTPAQSMNFFAGLQKFGVPSRYVRFPNEPHGFGKMKHQRVRDSEEIEWMQTYVRGQKDYKYPDAPSDKKRPSAAVGAAVPER